ncbi:hypothetical protein [Fretibacterium sp. OH1220_COT-178]|uniref:hypothetical protein n=1 Tax=Fretibacterium sp. OH1220_COT-178 TaxID=2491047 RepID=UPI000F5F1EEF|nr:hypothetical protein [Fretibacterium sp. OH1220_COT-178]RRD64247.1 hypothetical protein EII26_07775 [Fretibacterium sp. OH1220_COT-178]
MMTSDQWANFWWNSITGPHTVILKTVDALLDKNTVVLTVPEDLPWRHSMRQISESEFKQHANSTNTLIQFLDDDEECSRDREPGRYLLENIVRDPTVRNGYRESAGVTIQDYLVQNRALQNCVVWVKGLDGNRASKWIEFCSKYTVHSVEDGLFVLEVKDNVFVPNRKQLKSIKFSDYVGGYDLQLFNSFVLDDPDGRFPYGDNWKKYIANVAALLCGMDAEVSERLIGTTDFKHEEPLERVRCVADMPEFERRGSNVASTHILACSRQGNVAELKKRLWTAQVQVLFPLIEIERMGVIQQLRDEIDVALKELSSGGCPMKQYEKEVETPEDLDLGGLHYMLHQRKADRMYMLYLPDESLRKRIDFLRCCRNTLAHANCCTVAEVQELLDGHQN